MQFQYFRQVEGYVLGSFDRTRVEVLADGVATTVFALDSRNASIPAWTDSGAISLAAFAAQTVRVRFVFDSVDDFANAHVGWLVDDVVVTRTTGCLANTEPTVAITLPADGDLVGGTLLTSLAATASDGGASFSPVVSIGDVRKVAAWTNATASVPAGSSVQLRVRVSDGAGPGDIVEGGIDDLSICAQ